MHPLSAALDAADAAAAEQATEVAALLAWEAALIDRLPGGRATVAHFLVPVVRCATTGRSSGVLVGPLRLPAVQACAREAARAFGGVPGR